MSIFTQISTKHWQTSGRLIGFMFGMLLMFLAISGIALKGLNLDLDFTGGYLTEFTTTQSFSQTEMQTHLSPILSDDFKLTMAERGHYWTVRQADSTSMKQRFETSNTPWLQHLAVQLQGDVIPMDAVYIGSQVGAELIEQGGLALLTAIMMILAYVAIRFEWRLALGAVLALFHDVLIVLGVFAWFSVPFDLTVLAAILAIIGYSLNDSIIVGDKLRETMRIQGNDTLDTMINRAITATMVRTFITSGTTLTTIAAIGIFAGAALNGFSLALFIGVTVGTYSSIAISSTLPQLLNMDAEHYRKAPQEVCSLP